jgi:hypothetical protein
LTLRQAQLSWSNLAVAGIAFGVAAALSAVGALQNTENIQGISGPFELLLASSSNPGVMIPFSAVLIFTSFKVTAMTMAVVAFIATVAWKWIMLGSLKPGTNVLNNK